MPITNPQRDRFGFGGSLALGVQRPVLPWLSLLAHLRTAGFLDGDKPENPGVKDPGFGTLNVATLGLLLRIPQGGTRRGTGLWIEGNGGGGFTGDKLRGTFDAAIGYGILGRAAHLGLAAHSLSSRCFSRTTSWTPVMRAWA